MSEERETSMERLEELLRQGKIKAEEYDLLRQAMREQSSQAVRESAGPPALRRSRVNRVFGGVCGGVAERWNLPPGLVRALTVLAALCFNVVVVLIYLIFWWTLPDNTTQSEIEVVSARPSRSSTAIFFLAVAVLMAAHLFYAIVLMPKFAEVYSQLGGEMPLMGKVAFNVAGITTLHLAILPWLFPLVIILGVTAIYSYLSNCRFRAFFTTLIFSLFGIILMLDISSMYLLLRGIPMAIK